MGWILFFSLLSFFLGLVAGSLITAKFIPNILASLSPREIRELAAKVAKERGEL